MIEYAEDPDEAYAIVSESAYSRIESGKAVVENWNPYFMKLGS